jgi:hypothetical protein
VGIPEAQARTTYNDLRGDIDRVDTAREMSTMKSSLERLVGADIHVRARPGMTAQWLARLVECHQLSEVAGASCTSSECPLGLARITTSVSATATGFTIAIRSNDSAVAREIARRAHLLVDPTPIATAAARP